MSVNSEESLKLKNILTEYQFVVVAFCECFLVSYMSQCETVAFRLDS